LPVERAYDARVEPVKCLGTGLGGPIPFTEPEKTRMIYLHLSFEILPDIKRSPWSYNF